MLALAAADSSHMKQPTEPVRQTENLPSREFRRESWRRFQLSLDPLGQPHRLPAGPGGFAPPRAAPARV
jgi:hypothetical protein